MYSVSMVDVVVTLFVFDDTSRLATETRVSPVAYKYVLLVEGAHV